MTKKIPGDAVMALHQALQSLVLKLEHSCPAMKWLQMPFMVQEKKSNSVTCPELDN